MPKLRTHSGTKKRIKKSATGKVMASHAFHVHLLSAKSKSSKRRYGTSTQVSKSDLKRIKQQITYVK